MVLTAVLLFCEDVGFMYELKRLAALLNIASDLIHPIACIALQEKLF